MIFNLSLLFSIDIIFDILKSNILHLFVTISISFIIYLIP